MMDFGPISLMPVPIWPSIYGLDDGRYGGVGLMVLVFSIVGPRLVQVVRSQGWWRSLPGTIVL